MKITEPAIMVSALRKLANDIQSDDGVANACLWEAANMIECLQHEKKQIISALENILINLGVKTD